MYLTQSLWRDEAFSILTAQRSLPFIVKNLGFEPPVYYALLHFWLKVFGTGEVAARSLSLLGFALATLIVIVWAEQLFKKHWLSWFMPLFFFTNPMLLYYAFEVRAYGWYIFFATASMYAYCKKRWVWYVIWSTLGCYTHIYFTVFLFAQALHWMTTEVISAKKRKSISTICRDPHVLSFAAIGLFIAPWLIKIIRELSRLRQSWFFPVNFQLIKSVLGNMFLGYEGTPWYGWKYTAWLSLILISFFVLALRKKKNRRLVLFFLWMIFVPLAVIVGISFVKPMFVNRYLIPVSISEVFVVIFAIGSVKREKFRAALASVMTIFVIAFSLWYPAHHPKLPIRNTFEQILVLYKDDDVILAASPLIFFESIYYSVRPPGSSLTGDRVYLYNPHGSPFPWYVGDAIVSSDQLVNDFPPYPMRAFLVQEDGTFEIVYKLDAAIPLAQ